LFLARNTPDSKELSTMSRYKLKFLVPCALAGILASPLGAFAASLDAPLPSRVVGFRDLDLNSGSGVATLYSRIVTAATEVCDPLDLLLVRLLRERFDCRQDAVARAVADVNSPALTSYYLTKTKAIANQQR
jgi:UrcA family protein